MVNDADAEALNRFGEEFKQVIEAYNAVIKAGKICAVRPAAVSAHQAIFALSQTVRTLHPKLKLSSAPFCQGLPGSF